MTAANCGISDELFNSIRNSISKTPYYKLLGFTLNKIGSGFAEIQTETRPEHTNPLGWIHGGVLMSLADAAMGNAVRSLGVKAVTVECSTSLVAAASLHEVLVADGKVLKAGKNLIFVKADVFCGDKLIATAKGTFYKTGVMEVK